jgi:phage shock protein C
MQVNPRRMYRSRDRQLAGIAGGMAEYLEIDPTIIRIAWIVVGIASGGLALVAYLLLALVIPNAPYGMGVTPAADPLWASQPGPAWPGQPGANSSGQPGASWSGQPGPAWSGQPGPAGSGQPAAGTPWPSGPTYASGAWTPPPASAQWYPQANASRYEPARQTRGLGAAGIVGIVLVVIGAIALLDVTLPGLRFGMVLGPAVILALGAALLVSSIRRPIEPSPMAPTAAAAPTPTTAQAETGPQAAWSGVPADVTPWPPSAAPTRPAEPQAPQPQAATPSTDRGYEDERTTVDPA